MPPCLAAAAVNAGRRAHESRFDEEMRGKLREALLNNANQLMRKFRQWDEDGDGTVSMSEFRKAVPQMGIPMMDGIPDEDIDALFESLDHDGSGSISYKELKRLLENKPVEKNPVKKLLNNVLAVCNSTTVQTLLYVAFVTVFQMLTETLRNPKLEYYFDKMITDTLIENHFDSSHNTFEDVRRVADIYEWGNYVLWPGLFGNLGPFTDVGRPGEMATKGINDLTWPDGDYAFHGVGATPFSVPELIEQFDALDWTEGVSLRQARVAPLDPEECTTQQLSGACYPEIDTMGARARVGVQDTTSFGYNWTEPTQPPALPYVYWSKEALGSVPEGQFSAAITSMRMQPTDGFIALAIPFFSSVYLDEEEGQCDPAAGEVTWYKTAMLNRTTSAHLSNASFFCVRLSPNGVHCRQLCDPTDVGPQEQARTRAGRNTGVVRAAVENWWNDLKRGHWLDDKTRVMTATLQLRSNHIGVRYRVTLMFELTATGGLLPSYDFETLVEDDARSDAQWLMMNLAMGMCAFFVVLEGIALVQDGPSEYFSDMWNLMDWLNFLVFFLVWYTLFNLIALREDNDAGLPCSELCAKVGFIDAWEVMGTARSVKIYLSLCVCIQLLKIIKFTNVLIPKMGLMTAVLGKGKMDLLFFGVVFGLSMFAFSNLFYVQLGSVMEDFNDQVASFISLARALFGDFDIDDIMNNSRGYLNAILFLVYLFVAVFILLSMFLAILGEAQAAFRMEQDDAKETGTAPPEYGVFAEAWEMFSEYKLKLAARMGKEPPKAGRGGKEGGEDDADEAGGAVRSASGRAASIAEDEAGEMRAAVDRSLADIRSDVEALQAQLGKLRPAEPTLDEVQAAKAAAADAKAHSNMQEVLRRFEAKMNRRMLTLDAMMGLRNDTHTAWGKVAGKVGEDAAVRHRRRRSVQSAVTAAATPGCGSEAATTPMRGGSTASRTNSGTPAT